MNYVLALWGMARPLIMMSVMLVYAVGVLLARAEGYTFSMTAVMPAFGVLLLVALSIHYINEYADYETDALTQPTPYSGGSGVLPRGVVPRAFALSAAWGTVSAGIIGALMLVIAEVMPLTAVVVLVVGTVGGWMYSVAPLKLAWRGWGEVTNAVLGGMLLPIYGYTVMTGAVNVEVVCCFIPLTMLVFLNLLATTWADRVADGQVGKYTLATRYQAHHLRWLYAVVAMGAYGLWIALASVHPREVVVVGLLALPVTLWGAWRYTRTDAPHASVHMMVVFIVGQLIVLIGLA